MKSLHEPGHTSTYTYSHFPLKYWNENLDPRHTHTQWQKHKIIWVNRCRRTHKCIYPLSKTHSNQFHSISKEIGRKKTRRRTNLLDNRHAKYDVNARWHISSTRSAEKEKMIEKIDSQNFMNSEYLEFNIPITITLPPPPTTKHKRIVLYFMAKLHFDIFEREKNIGSLLH